MIKDWGGMGKLATGGMKLTSQLDFFRDYDWGLVF
jgi:hypothetical protein